MTGSPDERPATADGPMRVLCACGWETTGTEDAVVVAASEHGERVHNMRATRAEILATATLVTDRDA